MNSRSAKRKKEKRAADKKARNEQRLQANNNPVSSSAEVIRAIEKNLPEGYVAATMDGVIRLDSTTPPNILGAYTESLESCVALIFFNNKNHQCVLIHKSNTVSIRHVIDELSLVSDGFKSLNACTSHLVYRPNPAPGSSPILWQKNIADHVGFIVTDYAMCVRAFPTIPKLEQHHASEGFVCINCKGKVDVNAKPSILQSSDHEKRHRISFINNYFVNDVERDKELLKLDLQYAINDWRSPVPFRLPMAEMFARDEGLKTGISDQIYPWLCEFSGRILLWCTQDPGMIAHFDKMSLIAGKSADGLPNVMVARLHVRISTGAAAPVVALSFNQEWLRANPNRLKEIGDYLTLNEVHVNYTPIMISTNMVSLDYLQDVPKDLDPDAKLADSVEGFSFQDDASQGHEPSSEASLLAEGKPRYASPGGSAAVAAALFGDKGVAPSLSESAVSKEGAAPDSALGAAARPPSPRGH